MRKNIPKWLFWTPRILSIILIFFLAMMSLDVFSPELSFWQILGGLLIHNIPVIILSIILWISWKYEIIGGISFILAGILYLILVFRNPFEWYLLAWAIQISGMAFFIGILFFIGWHKKS